MLEWHKDDKEYDEEGMTIVVPGQPKAGRFVTYTATEVIKRGYVGDGAGDELNMIMVLIRLAVTETIDNCIDHKNRSGGPRKNATAGSLKAIRSNPYLIQSCWV